MSIGHRYDIARGMTLFVASACLAIGSAAFAQTTSEGRFPKVAVELRGGVTSPKVEATGSGSTWKPGSVGSFGVNFGARPARFFQFDVGLDAALHAFGAQGTINTTGGTRSITDREVIVTMGPRVVVPSADDTVLLSFGGGYAYTRYDEIAQARANEQIVGFYGGSRSGNGGYVFAQVEFAPSKTSPVTFGTRFGLVQSTTNGSRVGQFRGGIETKDVWPTFVGTISFRGLR